MGIKTYLPLLISFFLSVCATPIVRMAAIKKGWMAVPVKDRWHKKPTALMGGIAIYMGFALPLAFYADFTTIFSHMRPRGFVSLPDINAAIFVGATLCFILGLLDDYLHIKPHTKLVGQILVASLMTFLGFRLHWFVSMTLDAMVTIFWIIGITNAFNLIDNMDGLCAGIAVIGAIYFAFLFPGQAHGARAAALFFAGAAGGFLIYNFKPASIFMGDCGSLPTGFTLSMLAIHYTGIPGVPDLAVYAVPVMVLLVPVLDTTLVTFIRILSGRKASTGGRDHTSHRLVLMGFSERDAVLFLYGVGAISGISAVFVSTQDSLTSPAVIIPLAISVVLMGIYLAQIRIYPEKEFSLLRNHSYTPILMELTYKKQIVLVILDFCLISFSYYISYRLRFNSEDFVYYFKVFLHSLPAIIACKFTAFFIMGIYRGFWRYMSSDDVLVYIKASLMATLLSVAAVTFIYRFRDFSKGIFLIDWLCTTGLLLGTRGSFRILMDRMSRKTLKGEKVLIYGAGRGGEILLREILNNKSRHIIPVGFIDDNPLKIGKKLQGYPILGNFDDMEKILEKEKFTSLLVSFNGTRPNNMEGTKKFCKTHGLILKKFSISIDNVEIDS